MNRQQRRSMGNKIIDTQQPITTNYGHNGQQVVMRWDRQIDGLLLTEEQVDGMIGMLKTAKDALVEAKKAANTGKPS